MGLSGRHWTDQVFDPKTGPFYMTYRQSWTHHLHLNFTFCLDTQPQRSRLPPINSLWTWCFGPIGPGLARTHLCGTHFVERIFEDQFCRFLWWEKCKEEIHGQFHCELWRILLISLTWCHKANKCPNTSARLTEKGIKYELPLKLSNHWSTESVYSTTAFACQTYSRHLSLFHCRNQTRFTIPKQSNPNFLSPTSPLWLNDPSVPPWSWEYTDEWIPSTTP